MKQKSVCASLLQSSYQKVTLLKLYIMERQIKLGNYCQL